MTPEALIIENMFRIANKDGDDVPFILNDEQRRLDESLTGRDLIPKARQMGISSYFLARYTAACLGAGNRRNVRAVVISHESEATQRMLARVKYFLEHLDGLKAVTSNYSANEITFPKTDSMFYIGTAGSRKFGRGDTITHLHCSEYAFWPGGNEVATGLFRAVPRSGEIAVESTGNGMNEYAQLCMAAYKGRSQYKLHFLPWHRFHEYTLDLSDEQAEEVMRTLDRDLEEDKLVGALTPGQILWRRYELASPGINYDLRKFKAEYPMTLSECFQAGGASLFYKVLFSPTKDWKEHERLHWHFLKGHPNPEFTYVLGADVAAGVERDSSSIEVICLDTMEQVAEYDCNTIPPDQFAGEVIWAGEQFHYPYTVVEQNNHGLVTLAYMRGEYPNHLIHSEKRQSRSGVKKGLARMGLRTTQQTKPLMVGKLRKVVAEEMVIHSELLMNQMTTFIEKENGELGADDGCHDDLVIAAACASWGMERGQMIQSSRRVEEEKPVDSPFLFDNILDELRRRGMKFPLEPQHGDW